MERELKLNEFFLEFYKQKLGEASVEGKKSLSVDFGLLDVFDPELADLLLERPEEVLPELEKAAREVQPDLPENFRIRIFNLPEERHRRIRDLRAEDLGRLLCVEGMITRASEVRPEVLHAVFQCVECGAETSVEQKERSLKQPEKCVNCGSRKSFVVVDQKLCDTRWIDVEELFEAVEGERPSSLMVYLKEDLVEPRLRSWTDPGNRIKITGILKQIPRKVKGSRSRQLEIYFEANHVEPLEIGWEELEITKKDEEKILELAKDPRVYEKLVQSIAPGIFGLEHVKEAIALQLFGGVPHVLPDGSRIRGDIHTLLIGDPSCLVAGTEVLMSDGSLKKIEEFGSEHLQEINEKIMLEDGSSARAKIFHAYPFVQVMGFVTEKGKVLKGSFNQPVLTKNGWKRLDELKIGEEVKVVEKGERIRESWEKVVEIAYELPQAVYDIEVPFHNRFIANGIVVHNTAKSQIMKTVAQLIPRGRYVSGKGVTAAGLCTTYDTLIQLENGELKRIGELVEEQIKKSGRMIKEGVSVAEGGRTKILSIDPLTLKATQLRVLKYWKIKAPKELISIKTTDGREIKVTPENPLLTIKKGVVKWVSASELKPGDFIATARFPSGNEEVESNFARRVGLIVGDGNLPENERTDVFWARVKTARRIKNGCKYVYDLTVENTHAFVGNGILIHNTASVVRDEEFFGGWILEAGAVVLANRSLLAIDEFEKVEKSDQIALHEAMEQGTVSIAKANIVATLPAQTAILAGGNPKLGRFDPYLPIKEQIEVPETLLARFDLKFALRDRPNPEEDARVADYILQTRHFEAEAAKPAIEPSLLRKFIAYARKNCRPKLSREAGERLKEFFISLRQKASEEEAPIPITLRQYEALIRLSEASAKIRLSDIVTEEDAERAIRLMKISLREFGFDPETGYFDIDRAEGQKVTAAQRSKIRIVFDILDQLTAEQGVEVSREEVIKRAREAGVEDVEEILTKMQKEGLIFSPRVGKIQKV